MALTSGVLEYFDESGNVMAQRLPEAGSGEFKMGTYVVVRESQEAVFFRDGQMLDTLGPGRHQITTANLPLITKLFSLVTTGGESPFKAELYFVSKQPFLNEGWGTDQPILFRDKEFGMVRLRAFGICSHRIIDNNLFINKVVGTRGRYARDDAKDFIRNIIVGRLNDALGEVMETILDLPKYYDEVGVAMKSKVRDDLEKYGIEIVDFIIKAITPPEEVQKAIDERTSMGAIGNMQQYMMFKAAKSMQDAANNQGGGAGMGMGMGAGIGMGMMMPGMMAGAFMPGMQQPMQPGMQQPMQPGMQQPVQSAQPEAPAAGGTFCTNCGTQNPAGAKFCGNCGNKMGG
ncbi:MAG TPA: SPFH domain-containing protein [Spirochaetota bacterium]|nr:SPFH domain-containing protein [Spirochaetota bacterium]HPH02921.1 SPFH domain-containing protein [Spirochaetota bacterium]